MPDSLRHLRLERDARGVATVTLDVQGMPVNIFSSEVFTELREIVNDLEKQPAKVVVFRSAKPSGFLAGADLHLIRSLKTPDDVRAVITAGHELFDRVERLPCPTVAVIHGPCLGGGLEFALACTHRVVRDDPSAKVGLPETQLGLIPGWGGTQRLPRVVGLRQSLRMILEGKSLSATQALMSGLADAVSPPANFETEVTRFIDDRLAGKPVTRASGGLMGALENKWPTRKVILGVARKKIASRAVDYPALGAALRSIESGLSESREAGYATEREEFVKVVATPTARNLIDIFLHRERARKRSTWVPDSVKPRAVKRVAVLGAGTMGAGIAQLAAINGTPVVLKDVSTEIVTAGMKKLEALTREAAAKGVMTTAEAETAIKHVTATAEWGPLAGVDLAIEAVLEREDVKRTVFQQLAENLGPTAVLASNTSALSVTRIAETTPNPERVAGLHFFNPVHRMPLVEVVRGKATDDATIATLVDVVRKLGKVPVVVADSPGFLVNRILFPYLDEAVRLTLEGVFGDEVDRQAVRFGMPMGPLELLDQIGVDIAADVSRTFAVLTTDVGPTPARFAEMVAAGALGKKSSRGFYEYVSGVKEDPTNWATGTGAARRVVGPPPGELSDVQKRLIYPMINEAAKCLESGVVSEAWMIDLAMVMGTGFAPFRGGPLRYAETLGIARVVKELDEMRAAHGERFEACARLRAMATE